MRTIVAITGASGSLFGIALLKRLPGESYAILSRWGQHVLREETGLGREDVTALAIRLFSDADLSGPLASGSNRWDAMVVLPCTSSTAGKIATGIADSLVTRAAAVTLKEGRRLVLCPRETPLSAVTLRQLADLARDGVIVMPVSPSFYSHPASIDDLVADFVNRVLQVLGVEVAGGWRAAELEGAPRIERLDPLVVPAYRAMSPAQRLATGFETIEFMRERIRAHLRHQNPDWPGERLESELAARIRFEL
ncbi:MAG: UbiX family flavin prenyltransferase [Gemmatimonadetes bacterium]|nr:UbiX family flavin prenyltransferase [Gemmatimonadota bacterium]